MAGYENNEVSALNQIKIHGSIKKIMRNDRGSGGEPLKPLETFIFVSILYIA